jgi:hypothetical protein
MTSIAIERWVTGYSQNQCHGCRFLAGVGVFYRGAGPYPPLHPHCTCTRQRISTRGMSVAAVNQLTREAEQNGTRAGRILARAERLRDRG